MSEAAHAPQLRFPEFSGNWEEKTFKQLVKLQRGSSPRPIVRFITKSDDGVNWIKIGDTKSNDIYINSTEQKITKKGAEKSRKVNMGEIILSNSMSYGKPYLLNIDGCIHDGWFVIRSYEANFDKVYLHQLLGSELVQKQYKRLAAGGVVSNISSELVNAVKINLPAKPEQTKIAAFLTVVDSKIEQLSKKQALLGEYKKGLMQQIFSQAIRFRADDGSEFPDWEEKKLGGVSDCLDNRRQPLNGAERNQMKGDIPYYGANGIVDYVNDYIFDEELVLLAEDGGNFNDFSSKPIAQKISGKAWVNNHAHILKAKNIITTNFLFYSLVHKDIRRYIVGGSRVKLNKSDLLSIKTILPPLEEQAKIANFLSSIDSKIEQVGKQLDESKQFKKALLQQMFV